MKKLLIIFAPVIVLLFAVGINRLFSPDKSAPAISPTPMITQTQNSSSPTPSEITATFVIYTNNTKRVFTDSKYHGLSENVYLIADNPEQVHVKKAGTTWEEFFATLPMKLSKTCLTTGTNQTFCTNESSSLKFFINGQVDRDALDKVIRQGDKLIVSYGPITDPNLQKNLKNKMIY